MLGRKILIADAEDHVLCVLAYKLRQAGFRVSLARDGDAADATLGGEKHDLIISELSLPGRADLELCAAHPELPAIILTSRSHDVPAQDLRPANVRHVLLKPFSPRQLVARVKEVLNPPDVAVPEPIVHGLSVPNLSIAGAA